MIERRHLFCGALVFSVAACSGAQQAVKWTPVPSAPAARWATCTLVNGDEALARQLGKLGWKSTGKDFPNISWSEDIAAVVSTVNPRLEPLCASLARHCGPGRQRAGPTIGSCQIPDRHDLRIARRRRKWRQYKKPIQGRCRVARPNQGEERQKNQKIDVGATDAGATDRTFTTPERALGTRRDEPYRLRSVCHQVFHDGVVAGSMVRMRMANLSRSGGSRIRVDRDTQLYLHRTTSRNDGIHPLARKGS
jgi:hypothetical protein